MYTEIKELVNFLSRHFHLRVPRLKVCKNISTIKFKFSPTDWNVLWAHGQQLSAAFPALLEHQSTEAAWGSPHHLHFALPLRWDVHVGCACCGPSTWRVAGLFARFGVNFWKKTLIFNFWKVKNLNFGDVKNLNLWQNEKPKLIENENP